MLSLFLTLSWRFVRYHPMRSLLIVLSIALGVATWVATESIQQALKTSVFESANPTSIAADLSVTNDGALGVPRDLDEDLRKIPGVRDVQPHIITNVRIVSPAHLQHSANLFGVRIEPSEDLNVKMQRLNVDVRESDQLAFLAAASAHKHFKFLNTPPPALVGEMLAEELQLTENGQSLTISHARGETTVYFVGRIRGRIGSSLLSGNAIVMELDGASELYGKDKRVTRFDLTLSDDADRDEVQRQVRELTRGRARVQTPEMQAQRIQDLILGLEIGFKICGAGALVVGMFLVFNALSVSVTERRREIGILRSVGATRTQIRVLFVAEAMVLGAIGTFLGIPLGMSLADVSFRWVQDLYQGLYVRMEAGETETSSATIVSAVIVGLTTALLAALLPASQAAAEEPADTVRRTPYVTGRIYRLMQVGASALFLAAGGLLMLLKPDLSSSTFGPLETSYVGFALLMLGVMLATPWLTLLVTRTMRPLVRWWLPIPSRLAADNLVRSPGRTGLVIAALMAGVALTVQTAGVIVSNEQAVLSWIDRSYRPDLLVTSGGPNLTTRSLASMSNQAREDLLDSSALPKGSELVATCYRQPDYDSRVRGPTKVFLTLIEASRYYRVNRQRGVRGDDIELFRKLANDPNGVIVSENFARTHDVKVGETIELEGGLEGHVELRVIGTIDEYQWVRGSLMLDLRNHLDNFGVSSSAGQVTHVNYDAFEVYLPEGTDVEAARSQLLASDVGAKYALWVETKARAKRERRVNLRRTYGAAYAQQLLVGIVAVLGVVTALLISVIGRRRELGLLRAVGGTRRQLMQSVLAESLFLGLVGTLLGILVGIPLEHYVVRVVLFDQTGYLFPARFPLMETAVIAGTAMLLSLLAGLGPALHAMRLNVTDAIAYE